MIRRSKCDGGSLLLRLVTAAALMASVASPILARAVSPAPGSPLDSSDMLVVSDSSTETLGRFCMARDAAGDFVMVWEQFPGTFEVQRFDAAGKPSGSAFQVETPDIQPAAPSVAMDAAGDFVVAWYSVGTPYQQTATYDIHAQRYSAAGVAQGSELLVSTFANFDDLNPSVAMDAAGDFVIIWQGEPSPGGVPEPLDAYRIYARRYSAAGTALSDPFVVSNASANQSWPSVAMDAAGDFVAVWHTGDDQNLGYLAQDILAQRYDAAGVAQGGAFPLSTAANTGREDPHVAMDAGGRFVVAWINYDSASSGGTLGDIHAQRYDSRGTPQGSELAVNSFTVGDQSEPTVTMDAGGDFVVAWESFDQVAPDSNYDIYAQRYSAAGAPVGHEFLVNTSTADSQYLPIAAMDADGDLVVAWDSYLSNTPHNHIYFRRFASEERIDLKVRNSFAPATPGPGSSFSMTVAVDNASASTPTGVSGIDAALGLGIGVTAGITLPTSVAYQSTQGTDWTCTGPANAVLDCSYGVPLPAGSAASPLAVMLTAPSEPGSLNFSTSVSSTLKPVTSKSVDTSVNVEAAGNGIDSSTGGNAGASSSGGANTGGGSSGGGKPRGISSGKGSLDILSLVFLALPLFGRRRSKN